MIEKVGIFILFLFPLIFFHELGHYLFARLFGVRVVTFSMGFGKKLIKFKRGFTEYAISLIPFGGYVKMYGDDPLNKEEIPEDERKYSFVYQSKWARFWIVFGGPLANFLFAFILFWCLILNGEQSPAARFGSVNPNTTFYSKGIRSGDLIKSIDKTEIRGMIDLQNLEDKL